MGKLECIFGISLCILPISLWSGLCFPPTLHYRGAMKVSVSLLNS